jgi:hypothetical protein
MSARISSGFSSFFAEIIKRLNSERYKGNYSFFNDAGIAVMCRIATHYFRYRNTYIVDTDDIFLDALAKIINGFSKEEILYLRKQASSQGKSDTIKIITSQIIVNTNLGDFGKKDAPKLVIDVKELVEPKYDASIGHFIYLKLKEKYGINFVTDLKLYDEKQINSMRIDNTRRGIPGDDNLYKRMQFSSFFEKVIIRKGAFTDHSSGNLIKVDLWNDCFKDIFLTINYNLGYKTKGQLREALGYLGMYRKDTHAHGEFVYDKILINLVKAHYDIIRRILDRELKALL